MNKKSIIVILGACILIFIAISNNKSSKDTQPIPGTQKTVVKPQKSKQSVLQKIKNIVAPVVKKNTSEETVDLEAIEATKQAKLKARRIQKWTKKYDGLTPEQVHQNTVNLIVQARTKIKRGKISEAHVMVEELFFLDPESTAAKKLIDRINKAEANTQ